MELEADHQPHIKVWILTLLGLLEGNPSPDPEIT